jgi:hypothetical protein
MRWVLLDVGIIVATLVLLGLFALQVWRKVSVVRSAVGGLQGRLDASRAETAALSARLDIAEVIARLGDRAPGSP